MKNHQLILKPYFLLLFSCLWVLISSCAIHKAWQKNPSGVGELVPCSARVAKKVTETIDKRQSPKKILEIGAGSGALTGHILRKMSPKDTLDLVEIEPILCDELKSQFGKLPNVHIYCQDFLEFKPEFKYDYIVSSLPYNSFPFQLTTNLFNHMLHLAKEDAYVSFVEIKWFPSLKGLFLSKKETENYKKNRAIIENFYNKYKLYSVNVYMNFPPILIHHLQIKK